MSEERTMRYILLLLPFVCFTAAAQQKETTISISCYVNPELYLQANVIAHVSDKAGNISCNGRYISIYNQSGNVFYYKLNAGWVIVKPHGSTVVLVPGNSTTSSKTTSVYKIGARYIPDASGDLTVKIKAISQMNAQSDKVKAREASGGVPDQQEQALKKRPTETIAKTKTPVAKETAAKPKVKVDSKDENKKAATRSKPKSPPKVARRETEVKQRRSARNAPRTTSTAAGLRIEFGTLDMGIGPNIKHKFNRKLSFDAALLFFEEDEIGLGAQFGHHVPVKGARGLDWYVGIGPQVIFHDEDTKTRLIPVTGFEYNIPNAPVNLSLDWRPSFELSDEADVEISRFGLSLRIVF